MRKLILAIILLTLGLSNVVSASYTDSTKIEEKFCFAIEKAGKNENIIVDCVFYNNTFWFTIVENYSKDKWALYGFWVYMTVGEQLLRFSSRGEGLKINKYDGMVVKYMDDAKRRLVIKYRDIYMCTVYAIDTKKPENFQECIKEFVTIYNGEYD